jgi:uncharacterized membrane protein YphA (DoxX/SURF4 family)
LQAIFKKTNEAEKEKIMATTENIQQGNGNIHCGRRQRIIKGSAFWSVQVLLALLFLFAGIMKLVTPVEVMAAQMTVPLPGWFIQFIGVAEVAGALGLILPGLARVMPGLTRLAAAGLVIIMVGATVVTVLGGAVAPALFPLVVGLLCVTVIYARRSWGFNCQWRRANRKAETLA